MITAVRDGAESLKCSHRILNISDKKRRFYTFFKNCSPVLTSFSGFSAKTQENSWRPCYSGISFSFVGVPADVRTVVSVPSVAGIPAIAGLSSAVYISDNPIVSAGVHPTVTMFEL